MTDGEEARRHRFFAGLHELRGLKRKGCSRDTRFYYYQGWRAGYLDGMVRLMDITNKQRRDEIAGEKVEVR